MFGIIQMDWHYVNDDGDVTGPTTLDDIAEMLADHEELNIWCESGSDEWINVRSAADVNALRETPLNQPNAITADPTESKLPEGWEGHVDEASGNLYYYNESTGVTTWDLDEVNFLGGSKQGTTPPIEAEDAEVKEEKVSSAEPPSPTTSSTTPPAPSSSSSSSSSSLPVPTSPLTSPPTSPPTSSSHKTLAGVTSSEQVHTIQAHASDLATQVRKEALSSGVLYSSKPNDVGGTTITKLASAGAWKDVYSDRALPDNNEWMEILRSCRKSETCFVDEDFPANETSIWRDPSKKDESPHRDQCAEAVQWRRIKDILHQTVYVKVTLSKMTKEQAKSDFPKVAGFAIVQEEEYNVEKSNKERTPITNSGETHFSPESYVATAKICCQHGVKLEREQLSLLCTDYVAKWLNTECSDAAGESDHAVNFDAFFGSIINVCAPTTFEEFGHVVSWEEQPSDVGVLPFVRAIVPLEFRPHRIQLFERDSPTRPLVAPGDVRQGILGDCYYLGALSVVSTHQDMLFNIFPDIEQDLVIKGNAVDGTPELEQEANVEGLYAVRFWREGQWKIIIVDDMIPCNATGRPCFAQLPEHGCEIWVLIGAS